MLVVGGVQKYETRNTDRKHGCGNEYYMNKWEYVLRNEFGVWKNRTWEREITYVTSHMGNGNI